MRLEDKVIVVTGGASGIGHATIERVLVEGGFAVIADVAGSQGGFEAETAREELRTGGMTGAAADPAESCGVRA